MKLTREKCLTEIVEEIIEEVSVKICDDYCKYPNMCRKEDDLLKICDECPLNKL